MADVTISYKGTTIATMSRSGTKTLKTAGKYCEGDITIQSVSRCPKAVPVAVFPMNNFNAMFQPSASAVEVVE